MKKRSHLSSLIIPLSVLIISIQSKAETTEPKSLFPSIENLFNETYQWLDSRSILRQPRIEFSFPVVLAGVFSFIASSISSAGGIGGGGLYIPIMTVVAGLDLKTASSFSAFMVTGGSVANVACNLLGSKNPKFGGKFLIDFDLALLLEPCMLLGVSIGVICNVVFPNWLVTILFAVFLAWSTLKTCKNGIFHWNLESEMENLKEIEELETGSMVDGTDSIKSVKEPLLGVEEDSERSENFPWMKLGVLIIVWFAFFVIYLLRGNKYGEGIISIEPCGATYWVLSAAQIPLAFVFTLWVCIKASLLQKQQQNNQLQQYKDVEEDSRRTCASETNKCMFPLMSLLAGLLGGVFGIGGGMLISPVLLQVGIAPEVTAATCSFMVFFSSTMSAIQYLLLGMEHLDVAAIFAVICFLGSLLGLVVVQRVIKEYGRASIIVFSVSTVMALSTVLMTSFGAFDVWNDYVSGKNMGFRMPC